MYQIYQIMPGDTLDAIASRNNTTVDELRKINGLNSATTLVPGNFIVVPRSENKYYDEYIVKKGDNLYSLAQTHHTNVDQILLLNGLKPSEFLYPGQELLIPKEGVSFYVTKDGDTLKMVADALKTTVQQLIEQNNNIYLSNEQLIVSEQQNREETSE